MNEREPDEMERREAEALARALEGDGSADAIPDDALQAAALLRCTAGEGELADDRRRAVLARLEHDAADRPARRSRLRWLVPAGSMAALLLVAAVWVFGLLSDRKTTPPPQPVRLPSPGLELLASQARAAAGSSRDLASLGEGMRAYRRRMYDALAQGHPEPS